MRLAIFITAGAALGLAILIAIAGPGVRLGLWDYTTGLGLIRAAAAPIEIIKGLAPLSPLFTAAGLALFGGAIAFFLRAPSLGVFGLFCAGAALAAGIVPLKMKQNFEANPFIHDVTTDFSDPPPIIAGAALPRENPPDYLGEEKTPTSKLSVAEAQQQAFPDIEPKYVDGTVDETAETTMQVLRAMGLEILNQGPTDDGWLIEAADTSLWFGFVDDFVVRLRPAGAQTRIDVRSKSRVGGSDLGANAARIRDFFARMDAAIA